MFGGAHCGLIVTNGAGHGETYDGSEEKDISVSGSYEE
jgi:hypothetical protein